MSSARIGERRVPARDFYQGAYFMRWNQARSSRPSASPHRRHGYAYEKLKRKIGDYATAAAAVVLTLESGVVATCSIGLTNVAETPLFADDAAQILIGSRFEERPFKRAVAAAAITAPASDTRGPAAYRTKMAGVMLARALNAPDPAPAEPRSDAQTQIAMTVNGKAVEALVEPRTLLIHFLREDQNLTGPHIGCETSHCGACTIDLDGKSVKCAPSLPSRPMAPKS